MPPPGGRGDGLQPAPGSTAPNPPATVAGSSGPVTSNPNAPAVDPSLGGSAQSGSASSRGGAAAGSRSTGTKFRPKGNRRTEAERQRIAQEQERIQNKKIADDARQRSRGRFRRAGRARGGFRDRDARLGGASGPLADGTAAPFSGPRTSGYSGGGGGMGGGAGGSGGFKGRAGVSRAMSNKYSFADGIEEDDRINADELRARVGGEDEDDHSGAKITSATRKRRPILPVGIRREEFQAPGVTVATAEDIEVEEKGLVKEEEVSDSEEMWVDPENGQGAELVKDEGVWQHAAPKPRGKVKIKREDGEMVETMEIDEIAAHGQIKEPQSPEAKKLAVASDLPAESKPKKRKVAPRDPEDEAFSEDLDQLLGLLALEPGPRETSEAEPGPSQSALEGNMFLFQFPPVLPPLKNTTKLAPQDAVKDEPDDDAVMLDQPARGTPVNVDLTAEEAGKVKEEEDGGEGLEDAHDPSSPYQEGGYVGQLVLRKSGKVELSWGGQTLELVSGTPAQFLTTAVLLEESDSKAKSGEIAGMAFGMGKVEGKFVLAPKWASEEEWEVDPEDLLPSDTNVIADAHGL